MIIRFLVEEEKNLASRGGKHEALLPARAPRRNIDVDVDVDIDLVVDINLVANIGAELDVRIPAASAHRIASCDARCPSDDSAEREDARRSSAAARATRAAGDGICFFFFRRSIDRSRSKNEN